MAGEAITTLGIGAGGWGLIAVGIIIIGNVIAYLLRPRPLKDWAKKCFWAQGKKTNELITDIRS
jgi:hypothetical protein